MRSAFVKLAILAMAVCLLSACGQMSRRDYLMDADPDEVERKVSSEYNVLELTSEQTGLEQPNGIICRQDDILVCDQKKNAIIKLGMDGSYIGEVGTLGMGFTEFNRPTGIAVNGNMVYIVDANNHRIQVLNDNFEYIQSLELPDFNDGNRSWFSDIAVSTDGYIYASAKALSENTPKLCCYPPNLPYESVSDDFYGFLCSDATGVWAINSMELYAAKDIEGAMPGETQLFRISSNKIDKQAALPFGYYPVDFKICENRIYCLSAG